MSSGRSSSEDSPTIASRFFAFGQACAAADWQPNAANLKPMLEELRHVTPRAPRHRRSSRASPMSLVSGRNPTGKGRGHTRTPLRQRCPGMLCPRIPPASATGRSAVFWTASSISRGESRSPHRGDTSPSKPLQSTSKLKTTQMHRITTANRCKGTH